MSCMKLVFYPFKEAEVDSLNRTVRFLLMFFLVISACLIAAKFCSNPLFCVMQRRV
jgi:hypothetical protein